MPPKQVYGRRKPVKAAATFSKFISPDKDSVAPGKDSERTTSHNKTKLPVTIRNEGSLEDGFAALNLEENKENCEAKDIEKSGEKTKDGTETQLDSSARRLSSPTESRRMTKKNNARKKDRSREVDKDKISAPKTKDCAAHTTQDEQTIDHAKILGEQSSSLAPRTSVSRRKLKAVLIPKHSLSPPMELPPTPESLPDARLGFSPAPEDVYTKHVSPLLAQSYGKKIISFEEWSSALESHFTVSKIAEASFSEVYRLSAADTELDSSNESVLKLIALKSPPNAPLPGAPQGRRARGSTRQPKSNIEVFKEQEQWKSDVNDVHSEVKLLQNLNQIPGFTNFREVTVLQGRPTASFANAWKAWNKSRARGKKSEFPDPSKKTSYEDTQLWAVVEMQDAGTDCEKVMESGGVSTIWEVWDVFWGVCLSVAKAEETCRFEHRDLHLENICIRSSRTQSEDDLTRPFIKDPLRRKLGFSGLDTTVIDYTLSRADIIPESRQSLPLYPPPSIPTGFTHTPTGNEEVAYLDLGKDPSLFEGDASEEYQYEIYRYMRGVALYNDPLQNDPPTSSYPDTPRRSPRKAAQHIRFDEEGDAEAPIRRSPRKLPSNRISTTASSVWRSFHPGTNLVWVHFILAKLLQHLEGGEPTALSPKQTMRNVEAKPSESGKIVKKACKLFTTLEKVNELLKPETLRKPDSIGSVKELVVLALEKRWLRIEDVTGA